MVLVGDLGQEFELGWLEAVDPVLFFLVFSLDLLYLLLKMQLSQMVGALEFLEDEGFLGVEMLLSN